VESDSYDDEVYIISKLSLRWGRFPSEIRKLPIGEIALMWKSYIQEIEMYTQASSQNNTPLKNKTTRR
jgi:hypothetical protein